MIGYLQGEVRHGTVVCGGVGHVVSCPDALEEGEVVELFVQTQMRDSSISLFGFRAREQRDLFVELCRVPNVGPQGALALLRDVGTSAIVAAIDQKDAKPLTAASGVGGKLADKIVALARVPDEVRSEVDSATPGDAAGSPGVDAQAQSALRSLGYSPTEATQMVRRASDRLGTAQPSVEELVSAALASVSTPAA